MHPLTTLNTLFAATPRFVCVGAGVMFFGRSAYPFFSTTTEDFP